MKQALSFFLYLWACLVHSTVAVRARTVGKVKKTDRNYEGTESMRSPLPTHWAESDRSLRVYYIIQNGHQGCTGPGIYNEATGRKQRATWGFMGSILVQFTSSWHSLFYFTTPMKRKMIIPKMLLF